MTDNTVAWRPTLDGSSNIESFMAVHGITEFQDLLVRSVDDPAWFWDAVVRFAGLPFERPYSSVFDTRDGIPWTKWFVGGTTNVATMCLGRWLDDKATAVRPAIVWEGENGDTTTWSFADLRAKTDALAADLTDRGIRLGDVVGLLMPMIPETVAAFLAIAKLGAIALPLFSGFGAEAIAVRLADARAKALVASEVSIRRGVRVPLGTVARTAAAAVPTVKHVVVISSRGGFCDHAVPTVATRSVSAEAPLLVAYTSGTTGAPKGAVHVHGGFAVKVAEESMFQTDIRFGDRLFWYADFGWIMGPWQVIGALANGATLCLYEGLPDFPNGDRIFEYVERHQVTVLGVSPTLVRSLMARGDEPVLRHDRSSIRILGSTGEPWNEAPWWWYFRTVGEGRCPIINFSGGSEVGACLLSPHPVQTLKPTSLGGPSLGMAVDVFDDHGRPTRGSVGELVCTKPWPGMTRGLWGNPERFLETYWSRWPDVWVQGDWASAEPDGQWYLYGRSDDTIKLSGKRLGPAEVESVVVSLHQVVEAAAVGIPDEATGEQLWVFAVLSPEVRSTTALAAELIELVAQRLGSSFRPRGVRFVDALPKTRSAKVMRRAIRAIAVGSDPGDLSSLEDPSTLDAIRASMQFDWQKKE